MEETVWPLYGLRLRTPDLELRLPTLELLDDLAAVAAGGVHGGDAMPFTVPWSAAPPADRARATYQHVLGTIAAWHHDDWTLSLAVLRGGAVVGRQDLTARHFPVTREAQTGSWLGLPHQGRGTGTQMRAAVLHLAFAVLGARAVTSSAALDNPASLGVSRRLGYRPDGLDTAAVQGRPRAFQRLRLDREAWEEHRTVPVEVTGFAPCRGMFAAPA